jgi:RNA polymerase sigma-70 factor, ECF subfamily
MTDRKKDEFILLIQRHSGIIHKVIGLYLDNEEDKKDLYQEILLQAWKSLQNFKGDSLFSSWLYKVSLYTILTFNKKRKNNEALNELSHLGSSSENLENHDVLYNIIKSLDEIDRILITLHLDGYKNKEIADITGMTQNHINVKIHRLKNKIIEKFKSIEND